MLLIVNGARQIGKTYIIREFGKQEFENVVYINLERNTSLLFFEKWCDFVRSNQKMRIFAVD